MSTKTILKKEPVKRKQYATIKLPKKITPELILFEEFYKEHIDTREMRLPREYSVLRFLCESYKSAQRQRIAIGNRVFSLVNIIGRIENPKAKMHQAKVIVGNKFLVASRIYAKACANENEIEKAIAEEVSRHPVYIGFLSKIRGIGELGSGLLLGYITNNVISNAPNVSNFWSFSGWMNVVKDTESNTSIAVNVANYAKYKHLLKNETLRGNRKLASIIYVIIGNLIKSKSRLASIYYDYKTMHNKDIVDGKRITKGHLHSRAMRHLIKVFLAGLWQYYREYLKLKTPEPWVCLDGKKHIIIDWREMVGE